MQGRRIRARRIFPYSVVSLRSSQQESVFLRRVLIELLSTHSILSSAVEANKRGRFAAPISAKQIDFLESSLLESHELLSSIYAEQIGRLTFESIEHLLSEHASDILASIEAFLDFQTIEELIETVGIAREALSPTIPAHSKAAEVLDRLGVLCVLANDRFQAARAPHSRAS
jgi:hypothetical protein